MILAPATATIKYIRRGPYANPKEAERLIKYSVNANLDWESLLTNSAFYGIRASVARW